MRAGSHATGPVRILKFCLAAAHPVPGDSKDLELVVRIVKRVTVTPLRSANAWKCPLMWYSRRVASVVCNTLHHGRRTMTILNLSEFKVNWTVYLWFFEFVTAYNMQMQTFCQKCDPPVYCCFNGTMNLRILCVCVFFCCCCCFYIQRNHIGKKI